MPWAGECWAIEAELTRKTVTRTTAIMRELLGRTGDYGCPAADAAVPGRPPRDARALYVCSAAARPTVLRAREALGPLAARLEVRDLPPQASLSARADAGRDETPPDGPVGESLSPQGPALDGSPPDGRERAC